MKIKDAASDCAAQPASIEMEVMRDAARTAAHTGAAIELVGDAFDDEDASDMTARLIALHTLAIAELDAAILTAIKRGMPAYNAASFAIQTRRDYEADMIELNRKQLGKESR